MKGPIAIFDILGYQNFLEKNPDLKSVESVLDLISETPNEIIKAIPLTSSRFSEIVQKGFRYLVFSDTIVCGFEFEKIDSKQHDDAWAYLIFHTQTLYRLLFSKGFPLRGVLHYGDFLLKGSCVAGIAMVESYKQMIEIDFAGVVVTEQAISQVKILLDKSPPLKMLMTECLPSYLFPMKSGKEQIFNIVDCMPDELREQSANRAFAVRESFWSFNKDIPSSAERIAANTVKLFDFLAFHDKKLLSNKGEKGKHRIFV